MYHNSYNYNQAALTSQQYNQQVNFPASYQAYLQNYTQTATGFTTSLSYPDQALVQAHRHHLRIGRLFAADLQHCFVRITSKLSNSAAFRVQTR